MLVNQNVTPFPTLAALRAAHNDLLKQMRDSGDVTNVLDQVNQFLHRGVATGVQLETEDDRLAAQSQLDYWSAMLYRAGQEPPDTTLAEFDLTVEPELTDSSCPYVGLAPFRESQREFFFGRRRLVQEFLVGRLKLTRLLALVGPNASGKSSVLQAGLIPALKDGALEGSAGWRYAGPITPTDRPLEQLAALLPPEAAAGAVEQLRSDPGFLARTLGAINPQPVVLLVDQFDELFTFAEDDSADTPFVDALIGLAEAPEARHIVLIGMRSDTENALPRFPALQSWFERGRVQLMPLPAAEFRDAIEKPAELVGLKYDPGLVDQIIADLLGEPGVLPLLQFTLLELWERRERNRITWTAYKQVGAGRAAMTNAADRLYEQLSIEKQPVARRLLLQLVRLERGMEASTRKVRRDTLLQSATDPILAERVLDQLIKHRLVWVTPGQTATFDQIELAHDALVRNWPKMVTWMERERTTLELRRKLEARAAEWLRLGRGEAGLLDPVQLAEAETWMATPEAQELGFDDSLSALVTSSRTAIERAQQQQVLQAQALAEAERQRAEAERERAEVQTRRAEEQARERRRLGWALIALGAMFFVAIVLAGFAMQQAGVAAERAAEAFGLSNTRAVEAIVLRTAESAAQQNAEEARRNADEAQRNAEEARKSEAAAVAAQATAVAERAIAEQRQRQARAGELAAQAQAASLDRPQLALLLAIEALRTSTDAGEAIVPVADQVLRSALLNISGRGYLAHTSDVTAVAFDQSSKRLLTAGADGQVLIWDSTNMANAPEERQAGAPILRMALSNDGQWLVTAGSTGDSIRLWDFANAGGPRELAITGNVTQVAIAGFAPRMAVAGDDGVTYVWDLGVGNAGQALRSTSPVRAVALSPDGRWALTGHADGIARLWDLNSANVRSQSTTDRRRSLTTVAISPDGRWVLIGGEDGDTHVWNLTSSGLGSRPYVYFGQSDSAITTIRVSPDSSLVATGSTDGTIYLWRLEAKDGPAPRSVLRGHASPITSVVFAPDGKRLATTSQSGPVGLWDLTAPDPGSSERRLYGHDSAVNAASFSADSQLLATGSSDRSVRVWDLTRPPLSDTELPANPAELVQLACAVAGRNMTSAEWEANLPGNRSYRATCGP